jgi:hypothetical protein
MNNIEGQKTKSNAKRACGAQREKLLERKQSNKAHVKAR